MAPLFNTVLKIARIKLWVLETFVQPVALLAVRLYVGRFIWQSGQTKLSDINNAKGLFESEFIPNWQANHIKHFAGLDIPFPVPPAGLATYASMTSELVFSVLLMLGLGGRLGAFGIFMLALSIQSFVYPDAPETPYEMLLMAVILGTGPGKLSLDYLIRRKLLKTGLCDKNNDVPAKEKTA
ncbi:MAG: DoxX family membrane protein [Micavibrio sp.]|nr:DoxX family membrane protein [Micavibrio sp.]